MAKFYRDKENQFHIAKDERGVYLRIGEHSLPVIVSTDVAFLILEALEEVMDD